MYDQYDDEGEDEDAEHPRKKGVSLSEVSRKRGRACVSGGEKELRLCGFCC